MTVRPPTLREKRRYILAKVLPAGIPPDPKELYYSIADAVSSLWGDAAAARIHPAVIAIESGCAFIRCQRGSERELATALVTVTACAGRKIALRAIATSGTMESLRARLQKVPSSPAGIPPGTDRVFDNKACTVVFCESQKIDVVEKGFKNTTRFYLTTEDLEDH